MDFKNIKSVTLAYIGDAVYELEIRNHLIKEGLTKVNNLQKEAIQYVSAQAQANILSALLNKNIFNEVELDIIKKARNNTNSRHPKNSDVLTYKHATALEALIGYLYLSRKEKRLQEIMSFIKR